jgi:hypothetical protein
MGLAQLSYRGVIRRKLYLPGNSLLFTYIKKELTGRKTGQILSLKQAGPLSEKKTLR